MAQASHRISPDAKILFVGIDPAAGECLTRLVEAGARHITVLGDSNLEADDVSRNTWLGPVSAGQPASQAVAVWLSDRYNEVNADARVENPLSVIEKSPDWVLDFSLVLTMSVARDVELGFAKILYEAPPRAIIISRSDEFHGKMRSQYKAHRITDEPGEPVLNGIELEPRPEPPLPEKLERVRKAMAASLDLSSPEILSGLLVLYASGVAFKAKQGYPPAHRPAAVSLEGYESQIEDTIRRTIADKGLGDIAIDREAIRVCCAKGWGALPITATVMAALVAGEGIRLLTSTGRPVNCVPADLAALSALGIELNL